MYGIVNKAIEQLVCDNFGTDKWVLIKQHSNIDIDYFLSNEPYDDDITYKLANSASHVLGITVSEVLYAFGEYWVLKTGREKYGSLMESGGDNFKEFIINLPNFHNRIMLIYPKLTPPEFQVSDIHEKSVNLHYFSKREGLKDFVKGLISGLGKMYSTNVSITLIQSREQGASHEIFHIDWE